MDVEISIDVFDLRLYTTSQATLFGCVLLSSAFAIISAAPRRVFLILAGNSFLHLLLDACQTKWGGGGVHLFVPVSWMPLNFGLFWPESVLTCALTLFGLALCVVEMTRGGRDSIGLVLGARPIALSQERGRGYPKPGDPPQPGRPLDILVIPDHFLQGICT